MGGDGGVIAVKREFVRGTKVPKDRKRGAEAAKDAESVKRQALNRSKHCAIDGSKLVPPVVACELGWLYNKEALLTALLEKTLNSKFAHIRGLKDVKVLTFAPNPDYQENQDVEGALMPQYRCPVTQMEFNGVHPFVFIWTTGWVLSEKAIREIGIDGLVGEYGPFVENDIIRLIPSEEEEQVLRTRMESKRRAKKDKKRSRELAAAGGGREDAADGSHKVAALEASDGAPKRNPKEATAKAVARPVNVSLTRGSMNAAASSVSKKEESDVFKKLFHSDKDVKTSGRDLMMSTAGFRYGLA